MLLVETHVFREINGEVEFLIIKRKKNDSFGGVWQMVTGRIENREKAYETAIREVREETNCEIEKLWVVPKVNFFYSPDVDRIIQIPVFLAKVNKQHRVKISSEHSEYKWVTPEVAKRYFIWEGQRESVNIIMQYLTLEKESLNFNEIKEVNNISFQNKK